MGLTCKPISKMKSIKKKIENEDMKAKQVMKMKKKEKK